MTREPSAPPRIDRWLLVCAAAAAVTGLWLAYRTLDAGFLHGTGGRWEQPDNDSVAYLAAWNYFLHDRWRFPVFALPSMGYPEGGSVLFNDAVPVAALLTRLIHSATGRSINPFGPWVLLTYVLQGVFAARVLFALGVRSLAASLAATVLAVTGAALMWRAQHTAVSSHFLILWALALYFENARRDTARGRTRLTELWALAGVTLLVNAYLFAMVMGLNAATLGSLAIARRVTRRDVFTSLIGAAVVVALALVAGYGLLFTHPASLQAMGFGHFSWNLAGLLVPRSTGVVRDATGGQYEGESYVGLGALLVLAAVLLFRPAKVVRALREHWFFAGVLALFALYAASNRIYAGGILLVSLDLPPRLEALGGFFRATGRFIWPVAYAVALLPLAAAFRWFRPVVAVGLAAAAVWLQLGEAKDSQHYLRTVTGRASAEAIDLDRFGRLIAAHDRVWQYPSYDCGGFSGAGRVWGGVDANRELQLQLLAARSGRPMNSIYMSRVLKDCRREAEWGVNPRFETGVLYLLGWRTALETPTIAAAVAAGPCEGLPWGIVCSTTFRRQTARRD